MSRYWALGLSLVLVAGFGPVPRAFGQSNRSATIAVYQMLNETIETKDFTEAMPFKQALQLIYEKYQAKGKHLPILVDINSFRDADADKPNGPYDDEVRLPAIPTQMTLAETLNVLMMQVKPQGAYLVRNFGIMITTRKAAGVESRLRELVVTRFQRTPLADTLQQLSDTTGATITIDPRLKDKAKTPITAEFRGDVTLDGVLTTVTDMAELRVVNLDNCLYVTTPENADMLEKRMRERREKASCAQDTQKKK